MIKNGLYVSRKPTVYIEEHGGAKIKGQSYHYLCFFQDGRVGYYGGGDSRNFIAPFQKQAPTYEGKIVATSDNTAILVIDDPWTNDKLIFTVENKRDGLHVAAKRESGDGRLWFEDIFDCILIS